MTKSLGLRHCPVCSSKTHFWGETHIHIKLTIWKGTIQWHLVHPQCCAVTTSVSRSFRETLLTTNKAVFLHPLASASMDLSTWGISPEPLAPSTQHVLGDQPRCPHASAPFLSVRNILWTHTYNSASLHPQTDMWAVCTFRLLWPTSVYSSLFECLSLILGVLPGSCGS